MNAREQIDRIHQIARADGRYAPDAFLFVSEAIGSTVRWLREKVILPNDVGASRGEPGSEYHVSGRELLEGIRRLALIRWGRMSPYVFRAWGIARTEDFGEIVFLMVEDPVLQWRKRECDTREDFAGGYDLRAAFDTWETPSEESPSS